MPLNGIEKVIVCMAGSIPLNWAHLKKSITYKFLRIKGPLWVAATPILMGRFGRKSQFPNEVEKKTSQSIGIL